MNPLLAWYDEHARDLPWREPSASPWAVLVSEFMLQQTPVARVLPVYERWLADWPTPADLAAEPTGDAVRAWGRLGYPRRALRLHAAATAIVERHGGEVPAYYDDLIALPGRRRLHRGRDRVVRVRPPARRARHQRPAGAGPRPCAAWSSRRPPSPGPSATLAAEPAARRRPDRRRLGGRHDGARRDRLRRPPARAAPPARSRTCARGGRPATRRTTDRRAKGQAYDGTDRQCRGRLLGVLRDSDGPVHRSRLDDGVARRRAARPVPALAGRRRPGRPDVGESVYALP